MVLVLMVGHMADGGEGQCVLLSVPHLGQWLGVAIFVAFCMLRGIGFVVNMSIVIVGSVCGVAGVVDMVIIVMVVVWVVCGALIVVGFNVVGCGSDGNGTVAVVICCNCCLCVCSFSGARKKGSVQKHRGHFVG